MEIGLIGGVEGRKIEIVDYDPRWPEVFREQSRAIVAALGDSALRIEHIGSTSVPGLAAKPIVDILLVVPDAANEADYLPRLEAAGYRLRVREPDFHEHRMFRTPSLDVHIHVFSPGSPEITRYLAFRDRLRTSVPDRERYERKKRELAARSWSDMNAYADAKSEVVEDIIAAALAANGPSC
ncbi:MAG TPA: GrpB family protein [Pirellulales bacterium]|nr:GrpB family protein [Pirellulales bacterium]